MHEREAKNQIFEVMLLVEIYTSKMAQWTIYILISDTAPSSNPNSTQKSKINQYFTKEKLNLAEKLARMVAKDGLTFKVFTTSQDLRDGLIAQGFKNIPKSPNTIRKIVTKFAKKIRAEEKLDIAERIWKGERFCISFDEWTSLRKRRYANVILHGRDSKIWNLGLLRIRGSLDAEKCLALVERRLKRFNLY